MSDTCKDIKKFAFSNNNSEPLRDLALYINLNWNHEYIEYYVDNCNSRVFVKFKYSGTKKAFACFNGDGVVQFYVMDESGKVNYTGNIDSHSFIGKSNADIRKKFAEVLEDKTGAKIVVQDGIDARNSVAEYCEANNLKVRFEYNHRPANGYVDWLSDADTWICPVCDNEAYNPLRFSKIAQCQKCGFIPVKFRNKQ